MSIISEKSRSMLAIDINNKLNISLLVSIMDADEDTETPEHLEISTPILNYKGDVDALIVSITKIVEEKGFVYLNHEVHEFLVITVY